MRPDESRECARNLILRYGWNTTCYQIVNRRIEHWFGSDSVVGYVEKHGVRIVAGAPVCTVSRLAETLVAFEESAKGRVCYFGAEERLRQATEGNPQYSTAILGAQPVWTPETWAIAVDGDASLRAQVHRAKNKGVIVRELKAEEATGNAQLRRVLEEWLSTRGLPTMHFLVEPETLGFLADRRIFAAFIGNRLVSFTTLCPIPERRGWLTEQFVRGKDAPNGTVETTLDFAVRTVGGEGSEFLTMGMVPLSREVAFSGNEPHWLRLCIRWMRAHGKRFYNFEGLNWFKQKFHPDRWDPIYAISAEPRLRVRTMYAIASAFTDIPPWKAVLVGGYMGLGREIQNLRGGRRS